LRSHPIIKRLHNYGYEAYLVGGTVRDYLLGKEPHDIDIVTSARPDEIEYIFRDRTIKTVGKNFGVVLVDGVEVATYRIDRYGGLNDKNVEVTFAGSLEEDLARRDLTINAMAFDVKNYKLIDLFGGKEDLKNKVIKFVGEPQKRILEDPNRIIRACRFDARLDGIIEKNTWNALREYSDYVETLISPERIRLEILKSMEIRRASKFFRTLHQIGALIYIFPSLEDCVNHPHGPHHYEDVFEHSMICGDCISTRYPLLKLATYLHDVGKPSASKINPRTNDLTFVGHVDIGVDLIKDELSTLKFSNREIDYISKLVFLHMRDISPGHPKALRRVLKELHEAGIDCRDLIRVVIADKHGNLKQLPYKINEVKTLLEFIKKVVNEKPPKKFGDLALDGNEIMEITGLSPGTIIGKILDFLLDKVLDEPELNTKEILTKLVEEYNEHI